MPKSLFDAESGVPHLTAAPAEHFDAGRALRETVPLEAHVEAAEETGRAARKNSLSVFDELTDVVDGRCIIVFIPPVIVRID